MLRNYFNQLFPVALHSIHIVLSLSLSSTLNLFASYKVQLDPFCYSFNILSGVIISEMTNILKDVTTNCFIVYSTVLSFAVKLYSMFLPKILPHHEPLQ